MKPTFTVLIGSIGRPTLKRALQSIIVQGLEKGDQVIVGLDAYEQTVEDIGNRAGLVRSFGFDVVALDAGYHWLGVEQINFAMREVPMTGTHIFTIGDDDVFVPGAFDVLREICAADLDRPVLYRFVAPNGQVLWDQPRMKSCHISGCCIAAPKAFVGQMHTRLETTHDFDWMVDILARAKAFGKEPLWLDYVGVVARPSQYPPIMQPEWMQVPRAVAEVSYA